MVCPEGELDLASAGGLRDALVQACDGGCRCVVLDLERVTFVDSSGLAIFVMAAKRLGEDGRRLVVANARGLPLRVLRLTGLDALIDVHPAEQPLETVLAGLDATFQ